jgi:hypothetical protein
MDMTDSELIARVLELDEPMGRGGFDPAIRMAPFAMSDIIDLAHRLQKANERIKKLEKLYNYCQEELEKRLHENMNEREAKEADILFNMINAMRAKVAEP